MGERAYKTDAFVLRARNLGEADRIFTLFTLERGKLDAVAKGARRVKSHMAGKLEFLSEVSLLLHAGRSLDVITSATLVHSEWEKLVEPAAFVAANVVAELLDAFCEPDLAQPEIYALLQSVVRALAAAPRPRDLLTRFELRLLDLLGILPELDACVRCGTALRDGADAWLDPSSGGLVCGTCHSGGDAGRLPAAELKNLRALAAPRGAGAALHATPSVARAVDALVTYHLGKRAKSASFLEELAEAR